MAWWNWLIINPGAMSRSLGMEAVVASWNWLIINPGAMRLARQIENRLDAAFVRQPSCHQSENCLFRPTWFSSSPR